MSWGFSPSNEPNASPSCQPNPTTHPPPAVFLSPRAARYPPTNRRRPPACLPGFDYSQNRAVPPAQIGALVKAQHNTFLHIAAQAAQIHDRVEKKRMEARARAHEYGETDPFQKQNEEDENMRRNFENRMRNEAQTQGAQPGAAPAAPGAVGLLGSGAAPAAPGGFGLGAPATSAAGGFGFGAPATSTALTTTAPAAPAFGAPAPAFGAAAPSTAGFAAPGGFGAPAPGFGAPTASTGKSKSKSRSGRRK